MIAIDDPCTDLNSGYLLVDVSNFSEFSSEEFKSVPCVPTPLTNFEGLMPRLIGVKNLSNPQLERLTSIFRQQAEGQRGYAICAWIDCDSKIDELAEHIACFLCGPGPDGPGVLWRFFDPQVLAITMSVFSESQRQVLFGPIKKWRFAWCRNWWLISQKMNTPSPIFDFEMGWPTAEQWRHIRQSLVLNNVMNLVIADRQMASEECIRLVKELTVYLDDCTRQLNITDEDDQIEFVYLCAIYGSAYRRHPKLAEAWESLKYKKINWTDVKLQLNSTDFALLKDK